MLENTTHIPQEPFRANFKQGVNGIWTAEFIVAAGDDAELNKRIGRAADVVLGRLDELNAGDVNNDLH